MQIRKSTLLYFNELTDNFTGVMVSRIVWQSSHMIPVHSATGLKIGERAPNNASNSSPLRDSGSLARSRAAAVIGFLVGRAFRSND